MTGTSPRLASGVRFLAPKISKATFSAAAIQKFSQAGVEQAYQEAADLNAVEDLNPARLAKSDEQVTAADFAGVRALMTPDAAKSWDQSVAGRASKANRANVYGIAFYAMSGNAFSVRTDIAQPSVVVTNGKVTLDGTGHRLVVMSDVNGVLRYHDDRLGKYAKMAVGKTVTFWMVKGTAPDKPWLIDGWQAKFQPLGTVPDVK